jgi:2-hydroxyacyl-CoA lyase 1
VIEKGATYTRAEETIWKLVDTTCIPFLPTPMVKGVVPDSHPLSTTATRSLSIGLCDVVLVIGATLNWLLHFGEPLKWSKDVKFILVVMDVCEEEIELLRPHVGIVGDLKRVVEMINTDIAITKKSKDNVLKMEAQVVILAEGSPVQWWCQKGQIPWMLVGLCLCRK